MSTSIDYQRSAKIREAFYNLEDKLSKLDLTSEDLEVIKRHARAIVASAEVRQEFIKQEDYRVSIYKEEETNEEEEKEPEPCEYCGEVHGAECPDRH